MKLKIEKIKENNLKEALLIYNYYIENSLANFEENKVSLRKFQSDYKKIVNKNLPYLVAKSNNKIIGLAYLNNYRSKSGYKFAFENSIYVHPNFMNKGIGNKLLQKLIFFAKKNTKIKNIIAVIGSVDNEGSIVIHKKNGFKKIGILKKIGYKKKKWLDSIFMQLIL